MTVTVNQNVCVGCGRCVSFCPRAALSVWGVMSVDTQRCTDCFGGMYYVSENAPLKDPRKVLDQNQTRWTRNCVPNCPVSAISVRPE